MDVVILEFGFKIVLSGFSQCFVTEYFRIRRTFCAINVQLFIET